MGPGRAFLIGGYELTPHLWIVLTHPRGHPSTVLLVSCTTRKPWSDDTVVLGRGDHSFIRHETVIEYGDPRIVETRILRLQRDRREITPQPAVDGAVLARVRDGLLDSPEAPPKYKQYLRDALSEEEPPG